MAKRGRKPTPDDEKARIIEHILSELATGRPIIRTCREDPGMPNASTFWRWYWTDEELRNKVAQARECGIEAKMDEALHIAETPMIGTTEIDKHINVGGVAVPVKETRHEDMLGHRRLVVETIHKQAQMLKPKTYGPKLDLTSGGEKIGLSAELEAARKRASE